MGSGVDLQKSYIFAGKTINFIAKISHNFKKNSILVHKLVIFHNFCIKQESIITTITTITMNNQLSPYGYAKDGKVYLYAYMDFPEREIGFVRESDEVSIDYFTRRFELARLKVAELAHGVQTSQNKGSYLMKLLHMREYLATFNGLGDFPELFGKLDALEEEIRRYILVNRGKNLDIKRALLQDVDKIYTAMRTFQHHGQWAEATLQLKDLKMKWIKTGSTPSEYDDELNLQFNQKIEEFFKERSRFLDAFNKIFEERRSKYANLINELRQINSLDIDATNRVQEIQEEWKNVGKIAKKVFARLLKSFKYELTVYYNRQKKRQEKPKTPLEQKQDLVAKVESMLANVETARLDEVKRIQGLWKNIAKIPDAIQEKDLNTKFKIACNEIFEYHFLLKTVKSKHDNFVQKTRFEQLKIKIRTLKDTIKDDEVLLNEMNAARNKYKIGTEQPPMTADHINLINKIKTKQRILKKLQDALEKNY